MSSPLVRLGVVLVFSAVVVMDNYCEPANINKKLKDVVSLPYTIQAFFVRGVAFFAVIRAEASSDSQMCYKLSSYKDYY